MKAGGVFAWKTRGNEKHVGFLVPCHDVVSQVRREQLHIIERSTVGPLCNLDLLGERFDLESKITEYANGVS